MLEMLRALAQSEAESSPNLKANVGADSEESPGGGSDLPADQVEIPHEPVSPGQLPAGMSGLMLLRATILGPEPDDTELHCRYCNRVFRLQEGGACFEGNAACADCEQRLNRDLVLPAVSKHRPHVYQVCDVASGPDHPKRPAWARKGLPGSVPSGDSNGEDDDSELRPPPLVENLQQA